MSSKINFIFFLLFACANAVLGQGEPNRIVFEYHLGIHFYSNDTIKDAQYQKIDRVIYVKTQQNESVYYRDSVNYTVQVAKRNTLNKNPINWKIIQNKTDLDDYDKIIYGENVSALSEYLDDSATLYKTFPINEFSPDFETTYLLPEDFSLDYYDIDTTYFACMCGYFEQKLAKNKYFKNFKHRNCSERVDFLDFKNRLIASENQITILSDFGQSFKIRLEYEGYYKEISLENPDNPRWLFYDSKTKKNIIIINPYIHDTINPIAHHWRKYGNFQAYKSLERIYKIYLEK